MDTTQTSPFYRFQGWRFIVLLIVFALYTAWYVGPGFFGQLSRLEGYTMLQDRGFYSGTEAIATLATLTPEGQKLKYLALIFDVPYMIMQALVFEAAIAFGILQMRLKSRLWQWLFILPIAFLFVDAFEDSALALALSTGQGVFGSLAGVFTAVKFAVFMPTILIALIMLIGGCLAALKRKFSH